ncbi:hypothetical protein Hanom_Chr07g00610911 [Helianthus anomalus]
MWHISNEWICGIAVRVRLNLASNIRFMYTGSHSLKQNPTSISLSSQSFNHRHATATSVNIIVPFLIQNPRRRIASSGAQSTLCDNVSFSDC